ncbi:HDL209Cp [Eremothecium sinecaudum]|uniref:glucan 1,4-alpha-glucosidase n=1 Tax=Eremothecium sinecaudum TaxID=45286 RepID=A0A109UYY1_9SACH|nr:HDL209Cp [Eremothecium sinecaudum]AMD20535.1 HDL209Cp [Eremothecium sinecaudum]
MEKFVEVNRVHSSLRNSFMRSPWTVFALLAAAFTFVCYMNSVFWMQDPHPGGKVFGRFLGRPPTVVLTVYDFKEGVVFDALKGEKLDLRIGNIAAESINRDNFTRWINEQEQVSVERMLRNIADKNFHDNVVFTGDVVEGAVIASPSKVNPDYFYQWVRDGAITINTVVNLLRDDTSGLNVTLIGTVLKYLNNSQVLQRVENPSGTIKRQLSGLGEPKFMTNNKAYLGPWGRPQNDGPALRTIAVLNFLDYLNKRGMTITDAINLYRNKYGAQSLPLGFQNQQELFERLIFNDLLFIMLYWDRDSFDLWEEVRGLHFFTSITQLKALKMGFLALSNDMFQISERFTECLQLRIEKITSFILGSSGFISSNVNYVVETPKLLGQRSGLDIGTIIGSVLTHDSELPEHLNLAPVPFNVDDPAILNVLHGLVKSMSTLYPINHNRQGKYVGVGLGRYPEDIYNGNGESEGNPWFLATATAAELLYKLVFQSLNEKKKLVIELNKDASDSLFWSLIFDGIVVMSDDKVCQLQIPYDSPAYLDMIKSLFNYGDSFLDVLRLHVGDSGEMSEQFNKYTGFLTGANNLTWSYSTFVSSIRWRNKALALMGMAGILR